MPKLEKILKDETFSQFAERFKVSLDDLLKLNQHVSELKGKTVGKTSVQRKLLENLTFSAETEELYVPDTAVSTEVEIELPQVPEPLINLKNDGFNWLTYETLFNQRPYRKTNQECKLGLYRIPFGKIKIFLRENADDKIVKSLTEFFFPLLNPPDLSKISKTFWGWKNDSGKNLSAKGTKHSALYISRSKNNLELGTFAVLPYNYEDNGKGSNAIGTKGITNFGTTLGKVKPELKFWKTASRSLVVDLKPLIKKKPKGKTWQNIKVDSFDWKYAEMPAVEEDKIGLFERQKNLKDEHNKNTQFKLSDKSIDPFGLKTGVQYVGWVNQQGVHKDKLEENSIIACLRSDLIVEMDKKAGRKNPASDPDLIIQTELLSITEKDPSGIFEFGDGIQVRDFTVLNREKIYIPPISIPFIGKDFETLSRRFEYVTDKNWRDNWSRWYGESLGKAKAILLLRYGLQMGSPNAQNFLLEFNPPQGSSGTPVPTGRVVIRDVGDMYLHREVLWAKLGGKGLPPQEIQQKTELKTLDSKIIQFECLELTKGSPQEEWRNYVPYETGSIYEKSYGPRGTQFHWNRFSTLSKGSSVYMPSQLGTDPDAYSKNWQEVLAAMCEWGIAHNKSYVKYIEESLKLKLTTDDPQNEKHLICWDDFPKAERYRTLKPDDKDSADKYYKEDLAFEEMQAKKLHNILAGKTGQDKIRDMK